MKTLGRFALVSLMALSVVACGKKDEAEALDNRLAAKADADPALTAALEDQIMVDTDLQAQANADSIRPPKEPKQTPIPVDEPTRVADAAPAVTLGSLAAKQGEMSRDSFNGCGLSVSYSTAFAAKIPADLPSYSGAKVLEAAGSDENGCALRAVSYAVPADLNTAAAHYAEAAKAAGYQVAIKNEGKGKMVSGRRAADGGSFYVIVHGSGAASTADLVVNNGR